MRKTNQKGFTIIELLVVIVIIGILIALALPQLFNAQKRGRDTDRKNDLKNIQQKLETYFNDEGFYPAESSLTEAKVSADDMKGPRDTTYTYTGADCETDGCQGYSLSADLENDDDPDADDDGMYVITAINQEDDETTTP